jgi:hypothetical protein
MAAGRDQQETWKPSRGGNRYLEIVIETRIDTRTLLSIVGWQKQVKLAVNAQCNPLW